MFGDLSLVKGFVDSLNAPLPSNPPIQDVIGVVVCILAEILEHLELGHHVPQAPKTPRHDEIGDLDPGRQIRVREVDELYKSITQKDSR